MPKRILTCIGTRPELVKLAPVIKTLEQQPEDFESLVCFTGQQRQLLAQAASVFDIQPDINLDLMQADQGLAAFVGRALPALQEVLIDTKPDMVLVQGDTSTVFCAALAAYYQQIPVGHVEAGLRTENKYAPFPEEMNRRLATRLADLHFAPTETARQALLREGVPAESIHVTGNTVIDALQWMRARLENFQPHLPVSLLEKLTDRRMVLITGHRRENFGEGFQQICAGIAASAQKHPEVLFVYPVHLNPNVQQPVLELLGNIPNITLLDPLDYNDFVWLMDRSYLVLTDSGGVQEEAPALGKPVLVMREVTERPEGIEAGVARLVGADRQRIVENLEELLTDKKAYTAMTVSKNPYGDGHAAERIVGIIKKLYRKLENE